MLNKLTEAAYTAPAGAIAPIDILYGHRPAMAKGNLYMAHRCGFTKKTLTADLQAAGFSAIGIIDRAVPHFDLWAIASKKSMRQEELMELFTSQLG